MEILVLMSSLLSLMLFDFSVRLRYWEDLKSLTNTDGIDRVLTFLKLIINTKKLSDLFKK